MRFVIDFGFYGRIKHGVVYGSRVRESDTADLVASIASRNLKGPPVGIHHKRSACSGILSREEKRQPLHSLALAPVTLL